MEQQQQAASLETLKNIRSIMERSSRFISLSGWSGVWAGCVALAAVIVGYPATLKIMQASYAYKSARPGMMFIVYEPFLLLAVATFCIAAIGAFYFTYRKSKRQGLSIWGSASRKLFVSVAIPLIAGGAFCLSFMDSGHIEYIAPACLAFYGMALVNGGKYTLGEIRYLGYCELLLGCTCLFFPGAGLYFWAAGFGLLHIIYGIVMWNRYDKHEKVD